MYLSQEAGRIHLVRRVFNEQSVDSEDNARTVEVTITTDIQPKKLAEHAL